MAPSVSGGTCKVLCSAMVVSLLWGGGWRLWGGVINAEIRGSEADVEEIAASGEMEGAGLRGEAGALLHQVGNIFRGERLVDQGILHRPRHRLRGVDVAQGHNFAHVMMRIEAPRLQLEVIRLSARREREKAHEDLVIASFFALFQERLGMIGVFDICMPLVTADMAGNELVTPLETQTIGIGFQCQGVAGVLRGDGIAVGLDGNAKWSGGADLGHGGDIEGMQRHGT